MAAESPTWVEGRQDKAASLARGFHAVLAFLIPRVGVVSKLPLGLKYFFQREGKGKKIRLFALRQ